MNEMANSDNVRGGRDSDFDVSFGFGFNNIDFSDRLLQIEIFWEPATFLPDPEVVQTKTLHVNSLLLAAKSPFFYKLLTYEKKIVTLRINASEEASVMELLRYMYDKVISATTAPAVVDVLMAADKFEVASCVSHCSRLLMSFPMTPESASSYLELSSRVLMAEAVQPLADAAKQFLAARYKDIIRYQDEVMALPLAGVEAILSSDDLVVGSEDLVYHFVLKWARAKYSKLEERREILATRLSCCIRFPYLSCRKLKQVLSCDDFDHETASKLVLKAMFFKLEPPHRRRILAGEVSDSSDRWFVERSYEWRPVKIVEFELPRPQSVVYLDLKREECNNLFPSGLVFSQIFHLGGARFFLCASCLIDGETNVQLWGMFLGTQEKRSESFAVDYEFSTRSKPTDEFSGLCEGSCTFTEGMEECYRKLFQIPWVFLVGDDSVYFINGILHLRAVLTLRQ